jgi:hypothetical protein
MQAVTLMFTFEGVDWPALAAAYDPRIDGAGGVMDRRAWGYAKLMADYRPLSADVLVRDLNLGHEDDGSVSVNAIDVLGIDGRSASDLLRARSHRERSTASARVPARTSVRFRRRAHRALRRSRLRARNAPRAR